LLKDCRRVVQLEDRAQSFCEADHLRRIIEEAPVIGNEGLTAEAAPPKQT